ncbi:MAG: SpoIIE family protein phosphatase [Leptospiraceae bacterium]|nr:SpoIIE family protein phosphatase [Leptospiraceae bacterium]MDW8307332.1 SpoIIE family protein phosphatase [Leptospiraceae bacterium]
MSFLDSIYLNFFSLGAFIPFVFTGLIALFLVTLRDKSPASVYFAYFATGLALFNFGYVIAGWFYHPLAAYHRYITVSTILTLEIFVIGFFARFPEPKGIKVTNAIMIFMAVMGALMTAYFVKETWNAPIIFNFDGHYWDFDADRAGALVGYLIMFNALLFISTAIWKTVVVKKEDRLAMVGLVISILIVTIAPAVTNTMSREGRLDRGLYQTLWDLFVVLGMFMFTIVYVNNTKDRTTFMLKIVGVSVATFLLAFQAISFFSFDDKENAYDRIHQEQHQLYLKDNFVPEDMQYAAVLDINNMKLEVKPINEAKIDIDFSWLIPEYVNTWALEKIAASKPENLSDTLREIYMTTQNFPRFLGYRKLLEDLAQKNPNPQVLVQEIVKRQRPVWYRSNQVRKIAAVNFREKVEKLLQKKMEPIDPFRDAIRQLLAKSQAEGQSLKNEVLSLFSKMYPAGKRHYRKSADGLTHFTAFMLVDLEKNRVYEAGYSYLAYRKFIHSTAIRILGLLLAVLFVVLVGYRIFFLKALVRPLQELLGGVKEVNEGNLDTEIKIFVEDEIGYLSASFNNMVVSIREARRKLAEYAETLEEKVKERTAQLQKTLEEVQALKQQQDGDYFLTSLLTNPLCANTATSKTLNIQFLIDQKKKFEFRKWTREIGGDLCMASDVILKGRKHTFFVNADAMGKSIQGAGGIIVLGSVLQSLIERTRSKAEDANVFPERWLKNAFIELHKIFETFDGSMLVSLVMGLIDDETGLMYYINAEHPWTVLYRDKKASFIESGLAFRKLGTLGMTGTLQVSTFQLQPGDVIFAGSDGRDDLLLSIDEEGNRVINEDETLFLRKIEAVDGKLEKIKEELLKSGELTDDLSIIRIGYREDMAYGESAETVQVQQLLQEAMTTAQKGDFDKAIQLLEEANKINNQNADVLRSLVKIAVKAKMWDKAAAYAEDYVYLRPADSEMIYLASYSKKRIRDYHAAIDYGERLKIREPNNIKNIINLIDAYILYGNYKRASQLLEFAEEKEPDNNKLQKLKAVLEEKMGAASAS